MIDIAGMATGIVITGTITAVIAAIMPGSGIVTTGATGVMIVTLITAGAGIKIVTTTAMIANTTMTANATMTVSGITTTIGETESPLKRISDDATLRGAGEGVSRP